MSTLPAATATTSAPGSPRRRASGPTGARAPSRERLRRAVSGGSPTTAARLVDARCAAAMRDSLTLYAQLAALQRALSDASASVYEEHVRHAQLAQQAALRPRPHRRSLPARPRRTAFAPDHDAADDDADWMTATTSSSGSAPSATDGMDVVADELCTLCAARPPTAVTRCCAHTACAPCFSHVARCPWCRAAPLGLRPQ